MVDKNRVAQRFAKAQSQYRQAAVVQSNMARQLIWWAVAMGMQPCDRLLEIGCGDGLLTRLLPGQQHHWLNDLYQHSSLADYRAQWLLGDIEHIRLPEHLSVIVSNAVWQWVHDVPTLLSRCVAALQSGGWLCLTTFAPANMREIKALTGCGLSYPSLAQWHGWLENAGLDVLLLREERQTLLFDDALAVLRHLQHTGVTATSADFQWSKRRLAQFVRDYAVLARQHGWQNAYPLSYQPLYLVARKP